MACFFGGILLVIVFKFSYLGLCFELFGFLNLFGNFFPIALSAMRTMPVSRSSGAVFFVKDNTVPQVVGDFLNLPGVSPVADRLAGIPQERRARSWA